MGLISEVSRSGDADGVCDVGAMIYEVVVHSSSAVRRIPEFSGDV